MKQLNLPSALILVVSLLRHVESGEITDLVDTCDKKVNITKVTLDGCDQSQDQMCKVLKGAEVKGELEFEVLSNIEKLDCVLADSFGFGLIELDQKCVNGCDQNACPLKNGTKAKYQFGLMIDRKFPASAVDRTWFLRDGNEDQICFSIPVKIDGTAPPDTTTTEKPIEPTTPTGDGNSTMPPPPSTTPTGDGSSTVPPPPSTTPSSADRPGSLGMVATIVAVVVMANRF